MAEKINRNEVQTLAKNGARVLEVIGAQEFRRAHLPGAIHVPAWELSAQSVTRAGLEHDKPLIVYCYDYQ